jgi:hypothetical protein
MGGNGQRGNALIPILGALALAFLGVVFLKPNSDQTGTPAQVHTAPAPDADTAADTLRSMAAEMGQLRADADAARREAERLKTQQADELNRVRADLEAQRRREREADQADLGRQLDDLGRRLAPPAAGSRSPDLPIGGGRLENGLVWIEPLDRASGAAPRVPPRPMAGGAAPPAPAPAKPPEPAYTVPRNATLVGSTALTALIGRVPIKGQIEDPFPFKVLVGRDNLAANGLDIPGVFGMVFAGTAFGDWTLGCVRGHVDAVTFLFDDGTIRTVGGEVATGGAGGSGRSGAGSTAGVIGRGLGWISDRRGIPCVSGVRISNALDYLGGRLLARGIETAGKAYARSQTTVAVTPFGGTTSAVTGDPGRYALGETLAGGADELARFIAERQAQMFDVVYVDTGAEVAVHIDREIPIDYEPDGRRLDYARATTATPLARGGLD